MTLSVRIRDISPSLVVWGAVGNAVLRLTCSLEDTSGEAIALLMWGSGHGMGTAKGEDGTCHPKPKNAVTEEPSQYMEILGFSALLG